MAAKFISSSKRIFNYSPLGYQVRHKHIGFEYGREIPVIEPKKFEISRDPEEWKYVTRLFFKKTVPPIVKKDYYPSGWTPPRDDCTQHPYYIERTKNHMLPLYVENEDRGQLKVTKLRRIHGDIWLLHDELRAHIRERTGRPYATQIMECHATIKFKGDHYHWVEEFLLEKGF